MCIKCCSLGLRNSNYVTQLSSLSVLSKLGRPQPTRRERYFWRYRARTFCRIHCMQLGPWLAYDIGYNLEHMLLYAEKNLLKSYKLPVTRSKKRRVPKNALKSDVSPRI